MLTLYRPIRPSPGLVCEPVGRDNGGAVNTRSEVRLVTCLFVDVVGSTDATVRLGPERMQRVLGQAFAAMSGIIEAHGGTVEKYVGDAIFALFGVPTAQADDPVRALRAADACARWSPERSIGLPFAIRVGIETGEALVNLDALEERQRIAVGECVNLAARLQQHAQPGQIIVGPTLRDTTGNAAQFEPLGARELKGFGAVESWRFIGFRDGAEPPQVEFVGREAELETLRHAFDRARRGEAVLALVVGPPGQGKSRLASEALSRARPASALVARCRPGTEAGANTPLRQLLDQDLGDATPEGVGRRLASLLASADAREVAAAICHAAGLAADEQLMAFGRYEQREVIALSWRRYLEALAMNSEVAILIEDVHWADPVLLRVMDQATSDVRAPLVVVATARPEFIGSAHLRPADNRYQIELGPLDPAATERLAAGVTGGNGRVRAALARGEGNPLFIIELARSSRRAGELPVTLHAAIAARLDELPATERELLQRTSVAGESFDVRDAALLGEREPGDVVAALGRFAHLGFVTPAGPRYRFHHALVHDVAYGRVPVAERMSLHARYAQEGADPDDPEAQAHHWWEALRPPDAQWVWEGSPRLAAMRRDACRVHLAAGRSLEERNAYEEALEVYLRAVQLADDTLDGAAAEEGVGRASARLARGEDAWAHRLRAIELHGATGHGVPAQLYADMLEIATFNWGYFKQPPQHDEVRGLLDAGIQAARASGDDVSLARLLAGRAAYTEDVAGSEEIERLLASPDAVPFADAAHRIATVYLWAGRVSESLGLFETVFERLVPAGAAINEPEALTWYGLAAYTAGDLSRARELGDRLLEESTRRSAHTRQHALALNALRFFGEGDWAQVNSTTREMRALVDANPDVTFCLLGASAVAYGAVADVLAGRPVPADLESLAIRMLFAKSARVLAAVVTLPKVMAAADREALAAGQAAYETGLLLWDRYRTWDVADLIPAISLTMLERWEELDPVLARLDHCARGGSRLAEATAAAVREEIAASAGGRAPSHEALLALGYKGVSELLRVRAPVATRRSAPPRT